MKLIYFRRKKIRIELYCSWSKQTKLEKSVRLLRVLGQRLNVRMSTGSPGVLVQRINYASGKNEWKMMPEDYDYTQELARAAFADMLHDEERNRLYREGLVAAIRKIKERGDTVRVLDIGTGTGLLSMMAAVEGVDSIVACEEFRPMAECAARVVEENGFKDHIKIIRKRSTELTVGPGCDLEERANILVTEVFDTELIGEGAIGTYNHANQELLSQDRIVVPGIARMFAQAVSCKKASEWSRLRSIELDPVKKAKRRSTGGGGSGDTEQGGRIHIEDNHTINNLMLHDVQLSELDETLFTPLSPPTQVFHFDLACRSAPIPTKETTQNRFEAINSGECTAVFMWWDCFTDPDNQILLSCAPKWIHHDPKNMPWRDHWMQAIYYPQSEIKVTKGDSLLLTSNHDEYSLTFDVNHENTTPLAVPHVDLPMCRTRLGAVNNQYKNNQYTQAILQILSERSPSRILALSDQSLLGLTVAKLSSARVTVVQENSRMKDILFNIAQEVSGEYDLVVADPFYSVSVLPWHNLLFWFQTNFLKDKGIVTDSTCILPGAFKLWVLPVHYQHVWKIRAPLYNIQGFDMKHFDKIIEKACENCDNNVEPQPLWEYTSIALGHPLQVARFNLSEQIPEKSCLFTGQIQVEDHQHDLNGLAVWCEWTLVPGITTSSGPTRTPCIGEKVHWTMDSKQGVHFFKTPNRTTSAIEYDICFNRSDGDFVFNFVI
ncbi:protein arginine N-methyltransferase 7 isoform X2 [Eurytemora carolleeae]|uniref:protein arginine N-methyltransferase 7 isoform X2 n=1 Tax=Eurytemora carolleeae TaxID=1294199 RepID=UPI000C786DAB|nr:protein arginine N-methyltransferase 7 isoform X2 [Eurytemora carolleeae]|eukprot:XP_023340534.1 protein arginine N-methyltransferase 7-like isoform X2 [Eurytemora affinis]